ncbi:MAG TPA: S-layer homology domain-containing protein [Terriglobales bacterium]|nr:S-layer homology domain-containing protein [Terriglobales bacterium]
MDACYLGAGDTLRLLFCNGNYETGGGYSLSYGSGNSSNAPEGFGFTKGSLSVGTYEFGGSTYVSGYTLTVLEGTAETTLTALPGAAPGDAVAVYDGGGALVDSGIAGEAGALDVELTGLADGGTYQLVLGSYEATYDLTIRAVSPMDALADTVENYYQGADALAGDLGGSGWQTVCAVYAAEVAGGSYAEGAALPYFLPEEPGAADSALAIYALVTGDLEAAADRAGALVQAGGLVSPGYAYGLALNMLAVEAYNRSAGAGAIPCNKSAAISALLAMQDDCEGGTAGDVGYCSNYTGAVTVDFDTSAMALTALSLYTDADLPGVEDAVLSLSNWMKAQYEAATLSDFYSVSSTAACLLTAISATGQDAADWHNPALGSPLELMLSRYVDGGGFYYTEPDEIEAYGTDQATLALADYCGGNCLYTELTLNPVRQLGTALVYTVGDSGLDAGVRAVLSEGKTLSEVMAAAGVPGGHTFYEAGANSVTRRGGSYGGLTAGAVLLAVPDGVTDLVYFIGDSGTSPVAGGASAAFGAGRALTLVDLSLPAVDDLAAGTSDDAVAVPLAGCKVTASGGTLSGGGMTDAQGHITVTPVGGETTVTPYVSYYDYSAGLQFYVDADGDGDKDATDAAAARALPIKVSMAGGGVQRRTVSVRVEGPEENLLYYPAYTIGGDGSAVLTAADALCQAMDEKGVTYSYTGGYLSSITIGGVPHAYNSDGKGSYWSFVFNDAYANYGMSDTALHDGDSIVVYWTNSWGTVAASLENTEWDISGDKVAATVRDADGAAITGATVTLSTSADFTGGFSAVTDAGGLATFDSLTSAAAISAGRHYIRIEKTADGVPQLVRLTPGASVTFTQEGAGSDPGGGDEQEEASLHVRVISPYGSYMYNGTVGWFSGMTAFDALRSTGLSIEYTGSELGVYVRKIGAYGEMDLGANSGWVYAVSGEGYAAMAEDDYPDVSSGSYTVDRSDYVLWRYTEDWTRDEALNSAAVGAAAAGEVVLTPAVTAKNGAAQVTLAAYELTDAVKKAKETDATSIVVAPVVLGSADSIAVTLPRAPLAALAGVTGLDLTVDTPVGRVTLPGGAIAAALSQADGATLTVRVEKVAQVTLTPAQQERLKGKTAYRVAVLCDDISLTDFAGKTVTVSLPCALKAGETPDGVRVLRLAAGDHIIETPCTYDAGALLATFRTSFPALYGVGYEAAWESVYEDVGSADWFYAAVRYASENSLFNGTSQTAFSPDAPMTRGMFATVLYRLEGEPEVAAQNGYADLADGAWYANAALWAAEKGLVTGYGAGLFGADDNLTREQMATILCRYAGFKGVDLTKTPDLSAFTDATAVSLWAVEALRWATAEGLISGITPETLVPDSLATRAQTAAILMRYAQNFLK